MPQVRLARRPAGACTRRSGLGVAPPLGVGIPLPLLWSSILSPLPKRAAVISYTPISVLSASTFVGIVTHAEAGDN